MRRRRLRLTAEWFVDGDLVGSGSEWGEYTVVVSADEPERVPGAVGVKGPKHFSATRRVVLHPGDAEDAAEPDDEPDAEDEVDATDGSSTVPASASLLLSFNRGTVDLVPEPDTRAARRQDWILRHPRLHVVRETLSAGGVVMWGLIFTTVILPVLERLLPHLPIPAIPWPDINLPDLPSIPRPDLPDLPSIPWPDLPDLPDWLGTAIKLLLAVTIAGVFAAGEVKRRRERERIAAEKLASTPVAAHAQKKADTAPPEPRENSPQ